MAAVQGVDLNAPPAPFQVPEMRPVFAGAWGGPSAESQLEEIQFAAVDRHHLTESLVAPGAAVSTNAALPDMVSTLDPQHHAFIDQFWMVQQHNEQSTRRGVRNPAFDLPQGLLPVQAQNPFASPNIGPTRDAEGTTVFDGEDEMCTVCRDEFENHQWVVRLLPAPLPPRVLQRRASQE